jgi:GDP-L-fucose synthase
MNILVLGHNGFLGKNIFRLLGYMLDEYELFNLHNCVKVKNGNIEFVNFVDSIDIDLQDSEKENILIDGKLMLKSTDIIINCAADVGGIGYNINNPSRLFKNNLNIGMSVVDICCKYNIKKLINIGTTCSYPAIPKTIPFIESEFWDGYPEYTNAPYGIAKKSVIEYGVATTRDNENLKIVNLIMANMYGIDDCFTHERSHVIPAIIKNILCCVEEKKQGCVVWGSGQATRDFLYIDDAVNAISLAIKNIDNINNNEIINIGSGQETKIIHLYHKIADIVGFDGEFVYDESKPDGQLRRALNIDKAKSLMGYESKNNDIRANLEKVVNWYSENKHLHLSRFADGTERYISLKGK